MPRRCALRVFTIAMAVAGLVLASSSALADQPSKKDIIKQARSGTVFVEVPGRGTGSGFVVDRDERLVMTCAHVMGTRAEARIRFPAVRDGQLLAERKAYVDLPSIAASVVDLDTTKDLCVLRLDRLPPEAGVVQLSPRSAESGEDIFSIGNPSSSDALWIYTSGTVRQVYRKKANLKSGQAIDARTVETQAPINPGDSGGPVFNSEGKLVGVNSYYQQDAALVSSCIDVTEVAGLIDRSRRWLRAVTPAQLRDRSQHYVRMKLFPQALRDLDRLVQLDSSPGSYLLRADALVQAGPTFEVPSRLFSFAISDCVQALRMEPNNGQAFALRGAAFLGMGAADQAVADYTEAIRVQPSVAEHFVQRGLAHSRRKDVESALKDFDKAHEIDAKPSRPQILRARVLLDAKDYSRALEAFNRAIEIEPRVAGLYDFRGDALAGLGRYEQAERDYTKAIEMMPDNALFLVDRASALNHLRQFRAALADCDKALALQPKYGKALYQRALASFGLERHDAALEDLGQSLAMPTGTGEDQQACIECLVLRGRVYLFGTRQFDQSLADLTHALEQNPSHLEALNLRGIVHLRREDGAKALADFTAASKLAPKSAVYMANRGLALMKLEKFDEAVADLTASIQLNPNSAQAYETRAKAYEKLNQKDLAAADAAKAAELRKGARKPG